MKRFRTTKAAIVLSVAVATTLAACGSSSSGSAAGDSGSATVASGTPILIGTTDDTTGPSPTPGIPAGQQAAIKYINNQLGGVAGHPLKAVDCGSAGSPETTIGCANKVIAAKPVMVLTGDILGEGTAVPLYTQAKLPVISEYPLAPIEYTTDNVFLMVGGASIAYSALASYAIARGYKSVAILLVNVPTATAAVTKPFVEPLTKKGVRVPQVLFPLTTTDMTPYVQQAANQKPDAIFIVGVKAQCTSALKAAQSLGVTTHWITTTVCGDTQTLQAAGAAANGAVFAAPLDNSNSTNADTKLFNEEWKKYGDGKEGGNEQAFGFAGIMNAYHILQQAGGASATTTSVSQFLKSAKNQPNFMAHPYTCDGKQHPLYPSACNPYFRINTYQNGKISPVDNTWYSQQGLDL